MPASRKIFSTLPGYSNRPKWTVRWRPACFIRDTSRSRCSRPICKGRASRGAMRPDEIDALAWSRSTDVRAGGLLPAIVQDADNQRVLMLGWMSREALQVTLDTGWVTFHSRSRGRLWTKGETSGPGLALLSVASASDGHPPLGQAR